MDHAQHVTIAVIGSGFGGLGTAVRLKQEGFDDFVVLERARDVGGVWRDNSYPGCACDVESHLYSFSFAPNPTWTRSYSPQPEIHAYLQDCARRFGILPHVRFEHEVQDAAWDEEACLWRIETSRGTLTADVLVAASGALSDAAIPRIPGLDSFEGKAFHSSRWDHDYDLTGKRVAVIGTGASAIQFVPNVQPRAARLTIFQRTPPWVLPRRDRALTAWERRVFAMLPAAQRMARAAIFGYREMFVVGMLRPRVMRVVGRMARRHLERTVADPALRAKLTPSYTMGCKRILISDDYYPALAQPNVSVETAGIREVRARSIVTSDGRSIEVDAIIFGTGFQVTDQPIAAHVRGRGGRTLRDVWNGSPKAHVGTTVVGFPSFFLLQGPNTGTGHTSVVQIIESQIEHVIGALRFMRRHGVAAIEPRQAAQDAFVAEVDRRMRGTVWTSGGCDSWYLDASGRNSTLWPGFTRTLLRRIERFDPLEYLAVHARRNISVDSARARAA